MELEELQSRLEHLRHLESRENGPETPQKAYLTMEDSEKNRYIEFLIQQKEERDRTIADKDAFIKNLQDTLDMLKSMHESDSKKIDEMLAKINDLTAQLKLKNKQTFADKRFCTSQICPSSLKELRLSGYTTRNTALSSMLR